jgi:uncharacterized cupredoxin-like copper-binding protein
MALGGSTIRWTQRILGAVLLATMAVQPAAAAGDLSRQNPTTVKVQLGTKDNRLAFQPNLLTFETGKLYKLVLTNPSSSKHYFTSEGFAAAIWTRKVQDGSMEVKGAIREVELLPASRVEWWFVPVKTGTFRLYCHVDKHAELGMVGKITIK